MALKVNGELVRNSLLAQEAEALRQRFERLSDEQRRQYGLAPESLRSTAVEWARENVIEQVLLRQAALKTGKPVGKEAVEKGVAEVVKRHGGPAGLAEAGLDEDRVRAEVGTRLRIDRLISKMTARARPPRNKELAAFYRRHKDRFRTEETVRAAHIVKHVEKGVTEAEAREAAEALHARLQAGERFEQVADESSDCPGNGGDLGFFSRGKMVREFEEVVFGISVGETSGVFRTVFGFHIAKVLDRRPAETRPFREVRGQIRKELLDQRRTKLLERYVDRLREAAVIEDLAPADD
ncbi:MAG: peptidylprolyl isomerase [Bryobacterales bacterium]|nr:peptidylprolyl isomerase [Bryobacterales bacterium]